MRTKIRQRRRLLTLTRVFGRLRPVCAHEELALEQLDSDDSEHELQQQRHLGHDKGYVGSSSDSHRTFQFSHQYDVPYGLDGHDDALNNVFESLCPVDGPERPKHAEYTKDLDHAYGARTG